MATASPNNIARAIYLSLKDKNKEEQQLLFPEIVRFLARKRILSEAPRVLSRLSKIIDEEEGKVVAKISSRNQLSEDTKKEIVETLKKRYSVQEVYLEENLDKNLLGGFRIEANGEVIDLTLKSKISQLQEYITRSV